jgi:hypothetical protein
LDGPHIADRPLRTFNNTTSCFAPAMQILNHIVRRLADSERPSSLANRLRTKRFKQFEALVAPLPRPLRILDVGGEVAFWENRGWATRSDIQIFSLNLVAQERKHDNIHPVVGDATNLSEFDNGSFDVAFSNSVIEHLFNWENQRRMAAEIQRVGKAFWVQTPNFWFPMEPHFHVPGWQWMPLQVRLFAIRRWRCGWRGPCPDPQKAREVIEELRLLKQSDLLDMFPGATLIPERFCGLVKSWTVVGGFPVSSYPTSF